MPLTLSPATFGLLQSVAQYQTTDALCTLTLVTAFKHLVVAPQSHATGVACALAALGLLARLLAAAQQPDPAASAYYLTEESVPLSDEI